MKIKSFLNVFSDTSRGACIFFLLFFLFSFLHAQNQEPAPVQDNVVPTTQQAVKIQNDSVFGDLQNSVKGSSKGLNVGPLGVEKIERILVEDFESSELWYGGMFVDDGIIQVRKIQSVPKEVRDLPNSGNSKFVLGAKIFFLRRSFSEASIEPPKKIRVPGFSKKISVYVLGRGLPHTVYAVVRDMRNRVFHIKLGNLKYSGWRKLEAIVPAHIIQEDRHFATYYHPRGLFFDGFLIKFNPLSATGLFYVYFDNLSFETNMYVEEEEARKEKMPLGERTEPTDNW